MAIAETDYAATTTLPSSSLIFSGTSFNSPDNKVWFYVVNSSTYYLDGFLVVDGVHSTSSYVKYTGTEIGVDNNFSAIFGPDGNVWFYSVGTNGSSASTSHRYPKLVKISSTGTLLGIYDATSVTPQNLPSGYTGTLSPDVTSSTTGIYTLLSFNGQIWFQVQGSVTTGSTTTQATFVGNCSTSGSFNVYYLDGAALSSYLAYAACASSSYVYLFGGSDSTSSLPSFYKIATNGTFTKFGPFSSDPLLGTANTVNGLIVGTDNNIWFGGTNSSTSASYVGYITPTGSVTEFSITGSYYGAANIVVGLNNHIWISFLDGSSFAGDIIEITSSGSYAIYDSSAYTFGMLLWNAPSGYFYDTTLNLTTYAYQYSRYLITSTLVAPTGRVVNTVLSDTLSTSDSFVYQKTLAPFVEQDTTNTSVVPSGSTLAGPSLLCADGKVFFPVQGSNGLTGFLVVDDVNSTKSFVTFTSPSSAIAVNASLCILDASENIWTVQSSNSNFGLMKINKSGSVLNTFNIVGTAVQNLPGGTSPSSVNDSGSAGIFQPLTLGCDGNIWFTSGQVTGSSSGYRFAGNVTSSGVFSLYYLDSNYEVGRVFKPVSSSLAGMPSGNQVVHFFDVSSSSTYDYRVNLNGTFTKYGPFSNAALTNPMLKVTADGNLWFCGNTNSTQFNLGYITTTGTLSASAFVTGTSNDNSLNNMIQTPDGTFWFWLTDSDTIVNVTQNGTPTTYQGMAKPEGLLTFNPMTTAFYSPSNSNDGQSTQYSKFYFQSGSSSGTSGSAGPQIDDSSATDTFVTSDNVATNILTARNPIDTILTTDSVGIFIKPFGKPCTFSIQGFILPDKKVKFTEVICIIDDDTVAQGFKQTLNYSPLNQ